MQDPTPEPAPAGSESFGDNSNAGVDADVSLGADDKPFDDAPFEAGVKADEESEPKTYIQQLAGKLGNSLRKYNKDLGEPDYETEKFAINSVISATHTSDMDEEDQKDIIKKVKTSGAGEDDINVDVNVNKGGDEENVDLPDDSSGEEVDLDVEESLIEEGKWNKIMKGVRGNPKGPFSIVAIMNNKVVGQDTDIKIPDSIPAHYEGMKRKFPNARISIENGEGRSVYNESVKKLPNQEKNGNLVENIDMLKARLNEMTEVEEPVVAPVITPTKPLVDPKIAPSRRSKPFRVPVIKPGESPAPKATK